MYVFIYLLPISPFWNVHSKRTGLFVLFVHCCIPSDWKSTWHKGYSINASQINERVNESLILLVIDIVSKRVIFNNSQNKAITNKPGFLVKG